MLLAQCLAASMPRLACSAVAGRPAQAAAGSVASAAPGCPSPHPALHACLPPSICRPTHAPPPPRLPLPAGQLFKHKEFNFEKLGIGGLDNQFEQIFRRAFASRVFPPSVVERLGIRHVRGVLLYGPPGAHRAAAVWWEVPGVGLLVCQAPWGQRQAGVCRRAYRCQEEQQARTGPT